MDEEKIRDSFRRAKEDMNFLYREISSLKQETNKIKENLNSVLDVLSKISQKMAQKTVQNDSTHKSLIPTDSTRPSTHNSHFKPLKPQKSPISIGNQGVSTDRQTDRQTDIRHIIHSERQENNRISEDFYSQKDINQNSINDAAEMLDSLDSMRKEIRLKFKRLTDQELMVFSTLYQLEEQEGHSDYKLIAKKTNLTESSIRDYVGRLIKKGIPIDKKRINNKQIHLSVSKNLRKIASLSTILQLRDL